MTLFSEAFALVVMELREKKGWSKAALAEKAGLHQTYISMLEFGARSPNISTTKALAEAFGIPLSRMVRAAEKKLEEFGDKIGEEREKQWERMNLKG